MHALPLNRHALVAVLLCAAALVAGCLAVGGSVSASATSAAPRIPDDQGAPPAARWPADGPSLRLARELAEAHFGAAPCSGQVTVRWSSLAEGTNATASWRNPTDAWSNPTANFDCGIDFNTGADYDWTKLCSVMAHEIGHLLGRQHVDAVADLMAPQYTAPLPVCEQTPDPAAPPPPPPVVEEPAPQQSAPPVAVDPVRSSVVKRRTAAERRAARCRIAVRMLHERGRSAKRLRCVVRARAARRAARRR